MCRGFAVLNSRECLFIEKFGLETNAACCEFGRELPNILEGGGPEGVKDLADEGGGPAGVVDG